MKVRTIFTRKKNDSLNPLKHKSWDDISIKLYDEIVNINNNNEMTDFEKNVKILSLLMEKKEDDIMNENINNISDIVKYTSFLSDFNFNKDKKPKHLIINGMKCTIKYDIKDMTYAQFTDFQTFYKMGISEHMQNILSTLIVPDGHKYGENYDIDEFTNAIYNELSITNAQTLLFFFLKNSVYLFNSSKTYLISQMKKMLKKENNPQVREKITQTLALLSGYTV